MALQKTTGPLTQRTNQKLSDLYYVLMMKKDHTQKKILRANANSIADYPHNIARQYRLGDIDSVALYDNVKLVLCALLHANGDFVNAQKFLDESKKKHITTKLNPIDVGLDD